MDSPTSDAPRQSLLGSINFLARSARPRAATTTNNTGESSAPQPVPQLLSSTSTPGQRRRTAAPGSVAPPPIQTANTANVGLGYMLRRRRSATGVADGQSQRTAPAADGAAGLQGQSNVISHRIRLVPHLESHRSLHFDAITRDVRQGDAPLRIGRFTDRSAHSGSNSNKLAFKSKVVSRGHAEIWFDAGIFYIKDTKSSSGTFLNHIRLSSPNTESRPHPVKDGDILQLGVDYQGGTEEIYRCVKMRVELGREWQSGVNAFNSNALLQLKTLSGAIPSKKDPSIPAEKRTKSNLTDCCICLFQVTVCQSLFIAPCSHVYHYKCIRPLLEMHHPGFSCPLCRTFADLEADVEIEASVEKDEDVTGAEEEIPEHQEDVEMVMEDIAEQEDNSGSSHSEPQQPHPSMDTADTSAPAEVTHSASIAVPRRRSAEGTFTGADATPRNNTFLASLARTATVAAAGEGSGGNGSGNAAGLDPVVMSDGEDDEDDNPDDGADNHPDEDGAGIGGKRKR